MGFCCCNFPRLPLPRSGPERHDSGRFAFVGVTFGEDAEVFDEVFELLAGSRCNLGSRLPILHHVHSLKLAIFVDFRRFGCMRCALPPYPH